MHAGFNQKAPFRILPLVQPNIEGKPIDLNKISELCSHGLSNCPIEDRCMAWLALLNVFPKNPNDWTRVKGELMQNYHDYVEMNHMENWHTKHFEENMKKEEFEVNTPKLMSIIHNDIIRTNRQFKFFPPEEPFPEATAKTPNSQHERLMRRLERLLYVFAKINISFSYIQGFNELIVPLYYVISSARACFDDNTDMIDAIAFFSLQNLFANTDVKDFFSLQDQGTWMMKKLQYFSSLMERLIPETSSLLQKKELEPIQYAFRWFTVMFTQEYKLDELLLIWDALLAHQPNFVDFAYYIGVAQVKSLKPKIMNLSSASALNVIQQSYKFDVNDILQKANTFWKKDRKTGKKGFLSFLSND